MWSTIIARFKTVALDWRRLPVCAVLENVLQVSLASLNRLFLE
jgi:hypothetical protein